LVPYSLIGRLEHDLWRREHRHAKVLKARLRSARRETEVGAGEAAGGAIAARLEILVGVARERNGLPFAVQDRAQRDVNRELAVIAVHVAADIVGRVAVVVGAQIDRTADDRAHVLAAKLQPGLRNAITELRVEHGEARWTREITESILG